MAHIDQSNPVFDLSNTELLSFGAAAAHTGLRYMIIGGVALSLHGIARYTSDGDVWVEATPENWEKLAQTFINMRYIDEEVALVRQAFTTKPMVFSIAGPIDILTNVHTAFVFAPIYERSSVREVAGIPLRYLALDDLREIKVRTGRLRDLSDVVMIDEFIQAGSKK